MSNVSLHIATFLHETINMKQSLRDCFSDDERFLNFRKITAKNQLHNFKQLRKARTINATILTF